VEVLILMATATEFSLGSVATSLSPQERFEEFLQARGKRVTRQRRVIVDFVASRHEHFDAEQLLADLRNTRAGARASRPTIYRTLAEMVDAGLLNKMVLDGRAVYEHDYGYPQHDHLYCTGCRKLIEFSSDEVAKIRNAVAAQHQFRAQSHRLIVTGLCLDCRSNRSKSRLQDRV
jgi:Fur family ferric uptake transcriptional regulator